MKDASTQAGTSPSPVSAAWCETQTHANMQQSSFSTVTNSGDYGLFAKQSSKNRKPHKVPSLTSSQHKLN